MNTDFKDCSAPEECREKCDFSRYADRQRKQPKCSNGSEPCIYRGKN
jgi:hypothetical protein